LFIRAVTSTEGLTNVEGAASFLIGFAELRFAPVVDCQLSTVNF